MAAAGTKTTQIESGGGGGTDLCRDAYIIDDDTGVAVGVYCSTRRR
jgi:hypothetical protein